MRFSAEEHSTSPLDVIDRFLEYLRERLHALGALFPPKKPQEQISMKLSWWICWWSSLVNATRCEFSVPSSHKTVILTCSLGEPSINGRLYTVQLAPIASVNFLDATY